MADAIDYAPLIRKLAQQGVTPEEISRQFGTPLDYTRQVLGLPDLSKQTKQTKKEPAAKKPPPYRPPTKKKPVVWTDDHQDWLEKAVADGMDYNTIAERLDVPKTTITRKAEALKRDIAKDKLAPVKNSDWLKEWKQNNQPLKSDTDLPKITPSTAWVKEWKKNSAAPKKKAAADETNLDDLELSGNRGSTSTPTATSPQQTEPTQKLQRPEQKGSVVGKKHDDLHEQFKRHAHGIIYNTMRAVVTKGLTDNFGIVGGHIAHHMFAEHDHEGKEHGRRGRDEGDAEIMERVDHEFDGLTHQINTATGLMLDSLDDTLSILKHMNLGDRYNSETEQHGDLSGPLGTLHPEARKTVLGKLGMILKVLGIGGAAIGALGLGAMATNSFVHDHVAQENTPPEPVPEQPAFHPDDRKEGADRSYTPPVDKVATAATPEEAAIRAKDQQEKEANEVYKELKFKADEIEFKADKIIFNQKEGSLVGGSPGMALGGSGEPGGGNPGDPGTTPTKTTDATPAPSNGPGDRNPDPRESAPKAAATEDKLIDDHHGSHSDPQQPHATRAGAPPSSSPSTQGPGGYSPPTPTGGGAAKTSGHAPPSPLSHPDETKSEPFNLTPTWSSGSASGYDSTLDSKISDWSRSNKPASSVLGSQHPHPISRLPGPGSDGIREGAESYTPPTAMQPTLGSRNDKVDTFQMGRASIDQAIEGESKRIMAPPPPPKTDPDTSSLLKGKYNEAPEPVPPPPPQQPDATPAPPTPPPVPTIDPITKLPTQNGLVGGIGYGGLSAPISPTFFNRQYGGGTAPPNPPTEAPNQQQISPPNQQPVDQVPANNQLSPSEQDFQDQTNAMTSSLQPADITPSRSGDTLNMLSLQNQVASDTSRDSRGDAMTTSHRGGSAGHGKSRHTDPDAMAHEMLGTYFHDHFANIEGLDPHTINWGIG